jgi:hypothetical protein
MNPVIVICFCSSFLFFVSRSHVLLLNPSKRGLDTIQSLTLPHNDTARQIKLNVG